MIKPKEISRKANSEGVRQQQVEKDYIISWIIWGIYKNDLLKEALIFKGGTCIKKIHIEDYRYSEDLDFTLNPEMDDKVSDENIFDAFNTISNEIKEAANITLSIPEDSKEVHESGGIKFFIKYVGPLGGRGDHVKTDISKGEKLEFEVEKRLMMNQYSDLNDEEEVIIQCYGLQEISIEKMAALMGRTIPRDLYDFEYITNFEGIELQEIYYEFRAKAEHKGHNPDEFVEKVNKKEKILEKAWNDNLGYQIKDLQSFKDVWRSFQKQLRKFERCI
jgi:predicted nucleotidyltransferase component of viral defense system